MIVLVESHANDRAAQRPAQHDAQAGVRWGKASDFDFDRSVETAEMEERGGVTLEWPAEHIETVNVRDFSPVWRRYEEVRIESSSDPERTETATVTREMLFPVRSSTQLYVGGGIGYVEDPGQYGFEERVIHTYVRLAIPSPVPDAEVVDTGVEGAWPNYPRETFTPGGGLVPIMPTTVDWDR